MTTSQETCSNGERLAMTQADIDYEDKAFLDLLDEAVRLRYLLELRVNHYAQDPGVQTAALQTAMRQGRTSADASLLRALSNQE